MSSQDQFCQVEELCRFDFNMPSVADCRPHGAKLTAFILCIADLRKPSAIVWVSSTKKNWVVYRGSLLLPRIDHFAELMPSKLRLGVCESPSCYKGG